MASINNVVLVGNLTRDAELKYTTGGTAVLKFSIAINRRSKNGDQWVDIASFFDIGMMGKSAEAVHKFLVKGKQVAIQGELRQNRWEQDGQPRSKVEVFAFGIQLLGGREATQNNRPAAQQPQRNTDYSPEYFEDDIPF